MPLDHNDDFEDDILITKKQIDDYRKRFGLKRILSGIHLWGIGVGTVIAGTFFGWNYGLELSGSLGFFITTLVVTGFYFVLAFIFSELSGLYPYAGGPYAYVRKGLGKLGGYLTGVLTIAEFICASAAVTISIASYVSWVYPTIPKMYVALGVYVLFLMIDVIGIKQSANFQLIITSVAIGALIMFFIGTADAVNLSRTFDIEPFVSGAKGIVVAIPYALWFYLCFEGIALAAEETVNPKTDMRIGFGTSIITVAVLNFGVLIFCLATVDWRDLLMNDYPLSSAMHLVNPNGGKWLVIFTTLALSSLLASLHGMINGFSRQSFALSRAGYLPKIMSRIHPVTKTPYLAIVLPGTIGILLAQFGTARILVFAAGFSALLMYLLVILSYLRIKLSARMASPGWTTKVKAASLIIFSALIFSALTFISLRTPDSVKFVGAFLGGAGLYYFLIGRKYIALDAPEEREAQSSMIKIH